MIVWRRSEALAIEPLHFQWPACRCYQEDAGENLMQWLMPIMSWQSKQPATIRWLEALALFGVALAARYSLGIFYGGLPALTFYPVLLAVTAMTGWKEALAVLILSVIAGVCLFLPAGMWLQPVGWLVVGGFTIATVDGLKRLAHELSLANERQRVLFQELQHRVANTLQSVSGTLEIARRRIDPEPAEAKRILEDAVRRISASADVHRRLNDPTLFEQGLLSILRDAVPTVIDGHSTDLGFDIAPLKLSSDQMSVITMLVIEAANNAQKHVFERRLGRHFLVSLRTLSENRAMLSVSDDGPGLSSKGNQSVERTLGLSILQSLADQLHGTLSVKSEKGTEVGVVFPISDRGSARTREGL
jgi:two-component system, sensor histidine kinase PdtaS